MKEESMRRAVSLSVRAAKIYLPTIYESEKHHLSVLREPVLVVDLTIENLRTVIQRQLELGNPSVDLPEDREELQKWWREATSGRTSVEAKAAGVKSWKDFAQKARAYSIDWKDDKITVEMSKSFEKGALPWDPAKTREFPPDTPLEKVVEVLWQDIRATTELWKDE